MFFRQGKTRCGREEYVHLKSYRMSRFRIHLSHTHTHTTKANSLHVTSQSDKMGRIAPKRQQMDRGRWHTNTHTCSHWKQYPKKASQFDKVDDRRKKNAQKEREQFFNTHVWASIVQGRESTGWSRYVTHFFPSKDIPMLNKMWRKERLRTTTQSTSRQIFIPWKSWVIAKEGGCKVNTALSLPTLSSQDLL